MRVVCKCCRIADKQVEGWSLPPASRVAVGDKNKRVPQWSKLVSNLYKHIINTAPNKHGGLFKRMVDEQDSARTITQTVGSNLVLAAYYNIKSGHSYR